MHEIPNNIFMILAFIFGLLASIFYSFGPLKGMKGKTLSPIDDKDRSAYGFVALLTILALVFMALQIYFSRK